MKDDSPTSRDYLCKNYSLDPEAVVSELKEFKQIYNDLYKEEKNKKRNAQ